MCLIAFAWRPDHALPLVLAANRDEFYARPSRPLGEWPDAPGLYAGRDLEAGGSWLGVTRDGRFAALTNIRDPGQKLGSRSRGELVAGFLRGSLSPLAYLQQIADQAGHYSGFNLLVGTRTELAYLNAREALPQLLPAGLYGLSNAALDTPWPKLRKVKAALAERLPAPSPETLLALLGDAEPASDSSLPETGVGLATERLLSSLFIASPNYGTRASTALIRHADGHQVLVERSFGPYGAQLGEVRVEL
ncbi:NRDE family protein [Pseudomonas sp. UL073]|uniref:NRDE family protein n=1 Tax=Zestomonas insulae TaxID=2809017 RepID=A0ABS2IH73_9GAMM|nr:NRDE family protein [Pseudomonas insulae]MBM7062431.1 NRDE family protein [Pseudomonas insulae]